MNILIAEDDKNLGHVLKTELENGGFSVELASDGISAVLKFVEGKFDFVLLDIKMPRLDGIDTLRIIRKIDPSVPAVTFSGNAGGDEMAESVRAGAAACLSKPFEIAQLMGEIRKYARWRPNYDRYEEFLP